MAEQTRIEYAHGTLNFFYGCNKASEGCRHCFALPITVRHAHNTKGLPEATWKAARRAITMTAKGWAWSGEICEIPGRLEKIRARLLKARKPKVWLVQDLGDLFHQAVPDHIREGVVQLAADCPAQTFLLLTKRADEMQSFFAAWCSWALPGIKVPLPNLWPGVTVEDSRVKYRLHDLARIASLGWSTWCSHEPAIGYVDFRHWVNGPDRLRWLVAGGESGPAARPAHPAWIRADRGACAASGTPFFWKHWGLWKPICPLYDQDDEAVDAIQGYSAVVEPCGYLNTHEEQIQPPPGSWIIERRPNRDAGRLLDGRTWDEVPPVPGRLM